MKLLTAEQYNMTTPLRQFILKRGNTAVSSTYTGPAGEITYDTGLNSIRIHDGITPGGNLMPSDTGYAALTSNVTVLQGDVNTLFSNAAAQATYISILQSNVATLANLASSAAQTPPDLPAEGALWYDPDSGRLYVYFDGFWIDASPESIYTLPTATANVLGGVKIGGNLTIVDGVLSATTNLGNLTISDQTISGTQANADIIMSPNGTGWVSVPKLKIPVGSLIQGSANVAVTIANLTLNTILDYSTSSSDNLVPGDYDLSNGVSGAGTGWAVYEFTTNPSPVLEIGDHIAGVGIPFLSNVIHIGSGPNANVIITDQTITSVPPVNGEIIYTTRDIVNSGLNVTTSENTDISLIPGTGGHIITTSDIIPFVNDVYNLGTPSRRFKQIWVGAGTIYILDETLGTDLAIGARDGNLYVAGSAGLTVGKFTLTGNTIALTNPAEDFRIGTQTATGNLIINRPVRINSPAGDDAFSVSRTGLTTIHAPIALTNTQAVFSIIGSSTGMVQPRNFANTMMQITGQDNVPARMTFDAFGETAGQNAYTVLAARAARGSVETPATTQAGDTIMRLTGQGWTGDDMYAASIIRLNLEAAETFNTSSATGTRLTIQTTPIGSSTIATTASFYSNGMVLGTNTGVTYADGTRQTTAWLGDTSLDDVNANITAANVNIAALESNAATQAVQINSIATNAVNVVTAGFGMSVSRNNGTVGIDALGVTTVAGTANQVLVNAGTSAANAAITLTLPQSIATSSSPTFSNLVITGNLTVQGDIISAGSSTLDQKILYLANTATSQSQLDGGGIVLGNVNAAFSRSILYDYNSDTWDTDGAGLTTLALYATDATVSGNVFSNGSAHFGATNMTINYDNAEVQIDSNRNTYSQLVHHNHNSGTNASTDFVATNDIGNDENHYIDLGINSSNYNNPDYSITGPNDGYLFINGGNLAVGTQSAGDEIRFHTSGTESANLRVTITDDGLDIVNNVTVGSTLVFSDGSTQTTSANTIAQIINANLGTATNNITTLFANAAVQEDEISGLRANITAANTAIGAVTTAWTANAASQQVAIDALGAGATAANLNISALQSNTGVLANNINILFANATAQQSEITGLRANITAANAAISLIDANLGTATTNITTLFSNAAAQATEILDLRANITAANSAIVTANSAVVSYVNTLNLAMTANVNAANAAAISYTNIQIQGVVANAAVQENEITDLRANITAANAAIVTANSAVVSYVNTLNLSMIANVNAANALIVGSTYGNANVAVYLPYNATIQAINANVTAANGAIITANTGMKSYVDSLNSAMRANVIAANSAIVTANTGMKSYVDTQISTVSSGFTANAAAQQTEINGLRANITAANALITSSTYSNTNVSAYLSTVSTIEIGNIQITDQTIAGTVFGRDVTFQTNDNGANFVFDSNIMPSLNYVYTLGTKTRRWAKSYHGPKSIDIDGILLDTDTDVAPAGQANLFISNAGGFTANMITSNNGMRANGNVSTSGNVWVTGNVRSAYFHGDGSKLTNLPSGSSFGTSILSGTLTVDPASVGKNTVATQTFTISGLTTSHKVLITPATDLTYGIFITAAYASATNTVSVQFMNITGGSINLGSIDINYLAWV